MGLFAWLRGKLAASANAREDNPQRALPHMNLDDSIASIAAERDEQVIRDRAREFPLRFGPEVIPELLCRFNALVQPPPHFAARDSSLSAWISCWHVALYEILFQYREHAVPVFRQMARDGQNEIAIVLLCRLASEGINRAQILAEVKSQMPELSRFARVEIAAQLLGRSRQDRALAAVIEDLRQAPTFEQALMEARQADN